MKTVLSTIISLGLVFAANTSKAQESAEIHPLLDDRFTFRVGALANKAQAQLKATRVFLPETEIDLDTLGINREENTAWLSYRWRFDKRWALNFIYNGYEVNGGRIVDTAFNYDGVEYRAGIGIDTELKADTYVVDVTYAFWTKKNYEVGAGVGLHAFDLESTITAGAFIGDISTVETNNNQSLIAPVPNFRLFARYAFTNRAAIDISTGWLSMSYDQWDGDFLYLSAKLEYRLNNGFGAGIGYQYTDIDVTEDRGFGRENLWHVTFNSASLYLTYSF